MPYLFYFILCFVLFCCVVLFYLLSYRVSFHDVLFYFILFYFVYFSHSIPILTSTQIMLKCICTCVSTVHARTHLDACVLLMIDTICNLIHSYARTTPPHGKKHNTQIYIRSVHNNSCQLWSKSPKRPNFRENVKIVRSSTLDI